MGSDPAQWVAFVSALADALHAEGKLLAVTVPPMYDADYDSSSGYWVYDYAAMGKSVDILRIMAYDYSVGSPGPIAPLGWVQKVASFAATQLPPGKVQLGIPVYGRNWYVGKTGKCPVGQTINNGNYSMTSGGALASLAKDGVAPDQVTRDAASGELSVSYSIVYRGWTPKGEDRLHGQPTRFLRRCTVRRRPGPGGPLDESGRRGAVDHRRGVLCAVAGGSQGRGCSKGHTGRPQERQCQDRRARSPSRAVRRGASPRRCRWTASPMAVVARRCRRTRRQARLAKCRLPERPEVGSGRVQPRAQEDQFVPDQGLEHRHP